MIFLHCKKGHLVEMKTLRTTLNRLKYSLLFPKYLNRHEETCRDIFFDMNRYVFESYTTTEEFLQVITLHTS